MQEKQYRMLQNGSEIVTGKAEDISEAIAAVLFMASYASENENIPVGEVLPNFQIEEMVAPSDKAREVINRYAEEFRQSLFFQYWLPPQDE